MSFFFDEFPWLCAPKNKFFESFTFAWNSVFSLLENVKIFICGSASSWIIKKFIHAKAGLANRFTKRLKVEPFTLSETRDFLAYKGFDLTKDSIAEMHMLIGGIPYYLDFLDASFSLHQNIFNIFCSTEGDLYDEYEVLFASLFKNHEQYKKVVELLAQKRQGLQAAEISERLYHSQTPNGTLKTMLRDLFQGSFIDRREQLYNKKKNSLFFIIDEYVMFFLRWLKDASSQDRDFIWFGQLVASPSFKSWMGYNFEQLCYRHAGVIKKALGISGIVTEKHIFYASDAVGKRTSQIDLLLDRADRTISICEIKYHDHPYSLTKRDLESLRQKTADLKAYLADKRAPKKNISYVLITRHGLLANKYSAELNCSSVVLADLF